MRSWKKSISPAFGNQADTFFFSNSTKSIQLTIIVSDTIAKIEYAGRVSCGDASERDVPEDSRGVFNDTIIRKDPQHP